LHREQFNATLDLFDLANAIKKLDQKLDKYLGYIKDEESKILETFSSQEFHNIGTNASRASHGRNSRHQGLDTDNLNFERGTMLIGNYLDKNGHRNDNSRKYFNPTDIGADYETDGFYDGT
jgi:hypothetical protein